ncbi:MAG: rhodanese-like domain-containing protein [Blastocatellia bacterium]
MRKVFRCSVLVPGLVGFTALIVATACRGESPSDGARTPGGNKDVKHEITAAELKKKIVEDGVFGGAQKGKIVILDVRTDLGDEIIKGALHAPLDKLNEWVEGTGRVYSFPDKRTALVVTYCACPHDGAAESATAKLRELGFGQVYTLKGGLQAAKAAGIETAKPAA